MIYHIYANRSNIGDWLSAKGIQKLLSPMDITECLCDEPYIEETINLLHKATENDLIVIGGGGLFMDYFTPFWNAFTPIAHKVPFGIWGAGCCDLKQEDSLPPISLTKQIIAMAQFCIVRDNLTKNFLSLPVLDHPIACPSINVVGPVEQVGFGILHVNNYSTAGADVYEIMCKEATSFANNSGRPYRETNNRIKKDSEEEMLRVLSLYENSDIILSSALHGCIIAVAMGKKVIAVSGDRKIDEFMEAVNLKHWLLSQDQIHLIPERLSSVYLQEHPKAIVKEIRESNMGVSKQLKKLIAKNCVESTL